MNCIFIVYELKAVSVDSSYSKYAIFRNIAEFRPFFVLFLLPALRRVFIFVSPTAIMSTGYTTTRISVYWQAVDISTYEMYTSLKYPSSCSDWWLPWLRATISQLRRIAFSPSKKSDPG
ncbi:hypothetical protein ACFE04_016280 [Oxalis oulophora]